MSILDLFTRKKGEEETGCSSLGETSFVMVALELGFIAKSDIHAAVCHQRRTPPLEQILKTTGRLSPDQCEEVQLEVDRRLGKKENLVLARKVERRKLHKSLDEYTRTFRELSTHTRTMTDSMNELAKAHE